MSPAKLVTGFVSVATFLMAPGTGRAQTCTSDANCGKGLSCQVDAIAVPPVAICSAGDAGCQPVDTTATVTMSCQAASCTTDADCGANMVCHGQPQTTCTGDTPVTEKCDPTTGCDPNAVPVAVPPVCTTTTVSKCAYKYELPCNTDAECGDGFTCQPTTYGMCTGSTPSSGGGTASSGGGSASSGTGGAVGTETAVPPVPPDVDAGAAPGVTCTTVSTYPGYCSAKTIPCTAATDCPANWSCATVNTGTAVGGATAAPAGIDAGAAVPVAPPPETTTTSLCQPPSTRGTYGGTTKGSDQGTGPVVLIGDAGTGTGSITPPTPQVPGNTNVPTTEQTNAAATAGGSGCNIGGDLASDSAWLLGALAALGLGLARRRRA